LRMSICAPPSRRRREGGPGAPALLAGRLRRKAHAHRRRHRDIRPRRDLKALKSTPTTKAIAKIEDESPWRRLPSNLSRVQSEPMTAVGTPDRLMFAIC
jgi:hypothetical protein